MSTVQCRWPDLHEAGTNKYKYNINIFVKIYTYLLYIEDTYIFTFWRTKIYIYTVLLIYF